MRVLGEGDGCKMIDCHVHCRDEGQKEKEKIAHALHVAETAGLDGIFDMPNTKRPVISEERVVERLELAEKANPSVFYGLYVGVTADKEQVGEAVRIYRKFPQVVGLKMFAGKSVGDLTVKNPEDQLMVYEQLTSFGYGGVLAVHCEKESEMNSDLFDFNNPITHGDARPEIAETKSIEDQIKFAKQVNYMGKLHIVHVSTSKSVELVRKAKAEKLVRISCGVTPGHLLLDNEVMKRKNGIFYKVNPPLRGPETREELFEDFIKGYIDVLESDHAPHTYEDKMKRHMSGLPNLAFWPEVINLLKRRGAGKLIDRMTFDNVNTIFGTNIAKKNNSPHAKDYVFNPYAGLK